METHTGNDGRALIFRYQGHRPKYAEKGCASKKSGDRDTGLHYRGIPIQKSWELCSEGYDTVSERSWRDSESDR